MGYTNKEYINAFVDYHKCKKLTPAQDNGQLDISPLLPFILADTGYNYYMKQNGQLFDDIKGDQAKPIQQAVNTLYRYIVRWIVNDMKES